MQKGDKFIVVDSVKEWNGKIVTFERLVDYGNVSLNLFKYESEYIVLGVDSKLIKPLDRFPCDDEQPNID